MDNRQYIGWLLFRKGTGLNSNRAVQQLYHLERKKEECCIHLRYRKAQRDLNPVTIIFPTELPSQLGRERPQQHHRGPRRLLCDGRHTAAEVQLHIRDCRPGHEL